MLHYTKCKKICQVVVCLMSNTCILGTGNIQAAKDLILIINGYLFMAKQYLFKELQGIK